MRALVLFALAVCASAASVDGIKIHSTTHGKGPKTIIFVHGWTCDETSWQEQVPAFEKEYRVITIDLPGHGKSGSPKKQALSMQLFARAIEAVRAQVHAKKIVLVGHSMGVPVIRQYARMYPSRVAALVPVDGPLHRSGNPPPDLRPMMGPNGPKNREEMIRGMFGPATTPEMQDHILKMMLAPPEKTATQAMASMYVPGIWKDDVMKFPVFGIYSDGSGVSDPAYMKKVFPNSTTREMPGTGHFMMLEKPAEFNALLAGFLAGVKFR